MNELTKLAAHFERLELIKIIFCYDMISKSAGHTKDRSEERGRDRYTASKSDLEAETVLTKLYKEMPDLMAMLPDEGNGWEGFWFSLSTGMVAVCSKVSGRLVPVTILRGDQKPTRNAKNLPEELDRIQKNLFRKSKR